MNGKALKADLKGTVNSLDHFRTEALLPLFEAIANSIHAIEDAEITDKGQIVIDIKYPNSTLFDDEKSADDESSKKYIDIIEISDNGVGFTDDNFNSFCTVSSTYKIEKGGKGVGRFSWLKAFNRVEIKSVYEKEGTRFQRVILFSLDGIEELENGPVSEDKSLKTCVRLIGFKKDYRNESSAYKTGTKIAKTILDHCLYYFVTNTAPSIILRTDKERIDINDIFETLKKTITTHDFTIHEIPFTITHIKGYETSQKDHKLTFCANNRSVKKCTLKSYIGSDTLSDEKSSFKYIGYLSSPYLDKYVDSTRRRFDLPKKGNQTTFDGDKILSIETIKEETSKIIKKYLDESIKIVHDKKEERINNYIEENPEFRAVFHNCYNEIMNDSDFSLNASDEKLHQILTKNKGVSEWKINERHRELLDKPNSHNLISDITASECEELAAKMAGYNKDKLAGYIIYRKKILELLEKRQEYVDPGKYCKEEEIHSILFPIRKTSKEIGWDEHNLWIIDELLTFHEYCTSDIALNKQSSSDSERRPDIVVYQEKDEDGYARSISIIEFKRPHRSDNFDPCEQVYDYIRKIDGNKMTTETGVNLKAGESTQYYCFIVCDITDSIKKRAENYNFQRLKEGLGYYTYNPNFRAHMEILSYAKLVSAAKKRNKIFFSKLNI